MTLADERAFTTFARGAIRDDMLAAFRNGLRNLVNPATSELFTEEDIRLATQQGSRIYLKFDAIDLYGQAVQQRARFTAQQTDPRRATSSWLRGFHCPLWGIIPLPASSGSGPATWGATVGSTFVGSTTLGDPAATTMRDPAGNLYQVFRTVVVDSSAIALLTLVAVNGGAATNPPSNTPLTKVANFPVGSDQSGKTSDDFAGGFDAENDADLLDRLLDRIKRRPASGNNAQFRAWAREASNAIEDAWVYACAFNAGSTLVTITQKRGTSTSPTARVDVSPATLAAARAYLTPPASPVVPGRPFVLAQKPVSEPVSMGMTLAMRKNTPGGWNDAVPWPAPRGTTGQEICRISTFTNPLDFIVQSSSLLPGGASSLTGPAAPALMVWDPTTGSFEQLLDVTVTDIDHVSFRIQLGTGTTTAIGLGSVISPYTQFAGTLDEQGAVPLAVQAYFDSLGPGEVIDLDNDPRGARAYRWPEPSEEAPSQAGQSIVTTMFQQLGPALSSASVLFLSGAVNSVRTPSLPLDLSQQGPSLLTIQDFGVYSS